MPPSEMQEDRLVNEAKVVIGGGSISASRSIEILVYYILANDHVRVRLQEELREPMAGYPEKVPTWFQLEKLPYLSAIIKEGLR